MDDPKIEVDKNFFDLVMRQAERNMVIGVLHALGLAGGLSEKESKLTEGAVQILFKYGLTGEQVLGVIKELMQLIPDVEGEDDKYA